MRCNALLAGLLFILTMLRPLTASAAVHTFPAGSVLVPVDPCWQPVGVLPVHSGCAAGGSLAGAAGAYGLVYRLQQAGVPVYQVAEQGMGAPAEPPLVIRGATGAPVAIDPDGELLDPPAHLVVYQAAPFIIDAGNLDQRTEATLAAAPHVRRHRALLPFSAPVARVLIGLPPRIVAADQTAATGLASTLALAGLGGSDGIVVTFPAATMPPAVTDAWSGCSAEDLPLAPLMGSCGLPALFYDLLTGPITIVPRETVTTAPVIDDGILYAASFTFPGQAGHLRAFALNGSSQTRLWDAAERIPPSGSALPPPVPPEMATLAPPFNTRPGERMLFTNLDESHGFQLINFTAEAALTLQSLINSDSANAAAALINAARGRLSTSPADPAGSDDRSLRLGAISRSTPALVGGSPFDPAAAARDQVLYAGAEDGFLHAFLAGRRETVGGGYDHLAAGSGEELWGYLPGSLLPGLNFQPFDDVLEFAAVHVDGSPLVTDLFIDCNGDGHREWRTVLVATASIQTTNQGVVFALDVTDPHVPRLLWETTLPGSGLGRSRGAAIGRFGAEGDSSVRVFITAGTIGRIAGDGSPAPLVGSYGAMACALNLDDGRLLWQFVAPYTNEAINLAEPPTAPVLMLAADSGGIDGVLFGDLAGQLWALDPHSGAAFGGRPLWQSSAGAAEPIGGALAVHNRLALFGTGGVAHADTRRDYSVYALEILPEGGRLLWTLPLARGEKLWGAPGLDRFGRAYLGLGSEADDSGHLLVLGADGTPAGNTVLGGIPSGGVTLISGAVITVTRSGRVELIGDFGQETSRDVAPSGRVRVFSWRQR